MRTHDTRVETLANGFLYKAILSLFAESNFLLCFSLFENMWSHLLFGVACTTYLASYAFIFGYAYGRNILAPPHHRNAEPFEIIIYLVMNVRFIPYLDVISYLSTERTELARITAFANFLFSSSSSGMCLLLVAQRRLERLEAELESELGSELPDLEAASSESDDDEGRVRGRASGHTASLDARWTRVRD